MSTPTIASNSVLDGSTGRRAEDMYEFVIQDSSSSISLEDTFVFEVYGKTNLTNEILYDIPVSNFNDTGANPPRPASLGLTKSGSSLTLSVLAADGDFNNCVSFFSKNPSDTGCAASFKLDLVSTSTIGSLTPREYYGNTNFTGISAGLYDLKTRNGIVLLFNGTNEIVIAGPSQDGVGTRNIASTATYAWSTPSIYSIVIDYKQDLVLVTVTEEEGDPDIVLHRGTISSLGVCLEDFRLSGRTIDSKELCFFVANDGRTVGDTIILENFSLFNVLQHYVYGGVFSKHTKDAKLAPLDCIAGSDLTGWSKYKVQSSSKERQQIITFEKEYNSYVFLPIPGIENDSFCVLAEVVFELSTNFGDYSGFSLDIESSKKISLVIFRNQVALVNSSTQSKANIADYSSSYLAGVSNTSSVNRRFMFQSDGITLDISVLGDSYGSTKLISVPLADLPSSSSDYGFYIKSEAGFEGRVILKSFFAAPYSKKMIKVGGYTPTATNISNPAAVNYSIKTPVHHNNRSVFSQTATAALLYKDYVSGVYVNIAEYIPTTSGACVFIDFKISAMNMRVAGPYAIIGASGTTTLDRSVQLFVVNALDGTKYGCFLGDNVTEEDVAYRTRKGKAVSFPLKTSILVRYLPLNGLIVYDTKDSMNVLLEIPQKDLGFALKSMPNPYSEGLLLPDDISADTHITAAIGLLEPTHERHTVEFNYASAAIGRGYRINFYRKNPEEIYGCDTRVYVITGDND